MTAPVTRLEPAPRQGQDVPRRGQTSKTRLRVVVALAIVVAVVAASLALRHLRRAAPAIDRSTVWIDHVKRGVMVREVQGPGALVPEEIRWLTATTPARVADVRARSGALVEAGSIVVVLDNPDLVLQSLEADRQQSAAEAELVNLEATLRNQRLAQEAAVVGLGSDAQESARRAQADDALADRGFLSELERAQTSGRAASLSGRLDLERRRLQALDKGTAAQLAAQRAQVERLRSIAEFRKRGIAALEVRAGVHGVLQDVPVQIGQWVTPGAVLAKVAEPSRLKAELRIAESQSKDVALGQSVTVDTRNGMIPGKVTRMDGAVQNGSVKVDVALEGALPPGARPDLSVDGTITIERLDDVLFVGRPALARQGTMSLFKVLPDGDAVRLPVRLGRASVRTIEVTGGLAEGDTVILSDMTAWDAVDRITLK